MSEHYWKRFEDDFEKIVKGRCLRQVHNKETIALGNTYTLGVRKWCGDRCYYVLDDDRNTEPKYLGEYLFVFLLFLLLAISRLLIGILGESASGLIYGGCYRRNP